MAFFIADNIISPLGFTTKENFKSIKKDRIGIDIINNPEIYTEPFPAAMIDRDLVNKAFDEISTNEPYTLIEKILILSISDALKNSNIDIRSERTGMILSTTKGNIDLLASDKKDHFDKNRSTLWRLGEVVANHFNNPNQPIVLSNACISGVLVINIAAMLIDEGKFDHMIVYGGDIVSRFVVSGFMSFLSLSHGACKPFDCLL